MAVQESTSIFPLVFLPGKCYLTVFCPKLASSNSKCYKCKFPVEKWLCKNPLLFFHLYFCLGSVI